MEDSRTRRGGRKQGLCRQVSETVSVTMEAIFHCCNVTTSRCYWHQASRDQGWPRNTLVELQQPLQPRISWFQVVKLRRQAWGLVRWLSRWKCLPHKPEDLSLTPGTHLKDVWGKLTPQGCPLTSAHTPWHIWANTYTRVQNMHTFAKLNNLKINLKLESNFIKKKKGWKQFRKTSAIELWPHMHPHISATLIHTRPIEDDHSYLQKSTWLIPLTLQSFQFSTLHTALSSHFTRLRGLSQPRARLIKRGTEELSI